MGTNFTHYWGRKTAAMPALAHPAFVILVNSEALQELARDAFIAGADHATAVQRELKAQAERDAAEKACQAAMEAQGPAGLKPHFDEIFGGRGAA